MMTSLVGEYYQAFLAQGLVVGLGAGFLFVPSLAIVATYFSTKRAMATGITSAGGSIGMGKPSCSVWEASITWRRLCALPDRIPSLAI